MSTSLKLDYLFEVGDSFDYGLKHAFYVKHFQNETFPTYFVSL